MIFTGFKRKTNQLFLIRRLNGFLAKMKVDKAKEIASVLVITDEIDRVDELKVALHENFDFDPDLVQFAVIQKKPLEIEGKMSIFSPVDFGWYGSIKTQELREILTKNFDLLINYTKIENLYANLLLLQSNCGFRVGYADADNRFYDLMINCERDDHRTFGAELKKYLKILNKIL